MKTNKILAGFMVCALVLNLLPMSTPPFSQFFKAIVLAITYICFSKALTGHPNYHRIKPIAISLIAFIIVKPFISIALLLINSKTYGQSSSILNFIYLLLVLIFVIRLSLFKETLGKYYIFLTLPLNIIIICSAIANLNIFTNLMLFVNLVDWIGLSRNYIVIIPMMLMTISSCFEILFMLSFIVYLLKRSNVTIETDIET